MIRRIIGYALLLAAIGGFGYEACTHKLQQNGTIHALNGKAAPCSTPVTYSIGSIDARFGISTTTLAGYLKQAEATWEEPSGKDLFEYIRSSGDVTVDLIYDARQASVNTLKAAGIQADQTLASYKALKEMFAERSLRLDSEQAEHRTILSTYRHDEAAYNAQVGYWNRKESAPPAEDNRLQAERAALAREFAGIRSLEDAINADIATVNALATTLNQLIVQLHLNVAQYNRAGVALGELEEGMYHSSGGVRTINIYEYSDELHLVRVLAHELGHALGLEHVSDPDAVMFRLNRSDNLKATAADIAELNTVCNQ